jgi:hypothetical protein
VHALLWSWIPVVLLCRTCCGIPGDATSFLPQAAMYLRPPRGYRRATPGGRGDRLEGSWAGPLGNLPVERGKRSNVLLREYIVLSLLQKNFG